MLGAREKMNSYCNCTLGPYLKRAHLGFHIYTWKQQNRLTWLKQILKTAIRSMLCCGPNVILFILFEILKSVTFYVSLILVH